MMSKYSINIPNDSIHIQPGWQILTNLKMVI